MGKSARPDGSVEADVAGLIRQAGEIGVNSFIFAGLRDDKPGETLLHINRMRFQDAFNCALGAMKHVLSTHRGSNPAFSDEYLRIFTDLEAAIDGAVKTANAKTSKIAAKAKR